MFECTLTPTLYMNQDQPHGSAVSANPPSGNEPATGVRSGHPDTDSGTPVEQRNVASRSSVSSEVNTKQSLWSAIAKNDLSKVAILLDTGISVDSIGKDGCTALHRASQWGRADIAEELLQRGADINTRTHSGDTALHLSICWSKTDVAKHLIKNNAELELKNKEGFTPLQLCGMWGLKSIAQELLKNQNVSVDLENYKGETALKLAAKYGYWETAVFLLDKGADIEHKDIEGNTALLHAAIKGYTITASSLLVGKANINHQNNCKETALHKAVQGRYIRTVTLLLAQGADTTVKNNEGETPEQLATKKGFSLISAELQQHETSLNSSLNSLSSSPPNNTTSPLVENTQAQVSLAGDQNGK